MSTGLQIQSKITQSGELEVALLEVETPTPGKGEVLVRMEAAPINPSDMWPLFGPADLASAELTGGDGGMVLRAPVPKQLLGMVKARFDQSLPVGNEGSGTVIAAGEGAEELIGRTVGISHGASYAQFACVPAQMCLVLNEGTTAREGASSFVNPLTALGMTETMRLENHSGLVHTAAASNLGQMLNRICLADGVPLVNVVRTEQQAGILSDIGARHIVDSSADTFLTDLIQAIDETGATLGFDAVGGGQLASDILVCMEQVLSKDAEGLNTYGSEQHKQVYIYGGLNTAPTVLNRGYGMSWGVGGWLLPRFLQRIGHEQGAKLRQRVADEITSTFASSFVGELSLKEALQPVNISKYVAKKTGAKYLINPGKA